MNIEKDIFVCVQNILNEDSVLVRIINRGGVPYSIILERQTNGEFWERCSTPTISEGGSITEADMVRNYLNHVKFVKEMENN
jgi:hypothetical protein